MRYNNNMKACKLVYNDGPDSVNLLRWFKYTYGEDLGEYVELIKYDPDNSFIMFNGLESHRVPILYYNFSSQYLDNKDEIIGFLKGDIDEGK